jgi:hypothetical protein
MAEDVENHSNAIKEYKFGSTDFMVPIRADGMINATALCKAGGKKLNDYTRLKTTQEYLKALENNTGIPVLDLIISDTGGNHEGTWIHRKVGYHIAQWISPDFAVKVSNILDELFITGKVELGNEKTNEELENLYKDQIKMLTNQLETTTTNLQTIQQSHQKLLVKYNSSLQKHSYYKFRETGPCFYIFNSGYEYLDLVTRVKFGIAGTSDKYGRVDTIDNRLQSHRTNHPVLHLDFLIFTKDAKFIEDGIKRYYRKEINPNGHEWIEGVCVQKIIERVKDVLDEFCIDDYNIVSAEMLKKYNDYVITTVKVEDDYEEEDEDEVDEEEVEEDDDEKSEEEEDDVVVEEKSEEEEEEEEDEDEDDEEEDIEVVEDDQNLEEKIDIMKEQLDEYKEILLHLESYTVKKMDEILRKIGSSLTGTKDVKIKKIKDKLEPIIHKKPLTKKCDTCNLEKVANDKHFRAFKNKLLCGTCKACEFKKCAPAPLKIKPLVHTEITKDMETLKCHMCDEDKSVNDFYKNKSRGTRGYDYNCKNCETLRKCGTYDVREFKKKPADIPADCKWCPSCEKIKNRSTFCPSSTRGDGLQYSCRACYQKNRTKKKTLNKLIN